MGLALLRVVIPPNRVAQEVSFNLKPVALIFAIGVTGLVTGLCGLAPIIHSLGGQLRTRIDQSSRALGSIKYERLRSSLVIAEVALATVLLILAGLTLRTLSALMDVDVGFRPDYVLFARLSLPPGRYNTARQQGMFYRNILDSVLKIPGVQAAAEATDPPPHTHGWTQIDIPGKPHSESWGSTVVLCSEGYFNVVGRHLITGRFLSQDDVDSGRKVALVNQTLARSYFGSEGAVGKEIRFTSHETVSDWPRKTYFDIIGVVEDGKNHGLEDSVRPEAYIPYTVTAAGPRGVLIKTALKSDSVLPAFQRAVNGVDSDVVVVEANSIATSLDQSYYAGPRFTLFALGAFAGSGLLLAAVGVFGLIGYTVLLRSHEIAIRVAVGAQRGDIFIMILRKVSVLFGLGTLIGLMTAFGASRVLKSEVWGVSASDPWTVLTGVALLGAVILVASSLPAWRATRRDPMLTLRHE